MPTVTSPANASVKAARKLARRRHREASGRFLVEGLNVLVEARSYLEQVFVAAGADPEARAAAEAAVAAGAELVEVSDEVLRTLAATTTPRGLVGVARLVEPELEDTLRGADRVLFCCDVADPGNVGTIVRTADAAGADAVVVSVDSVDVRNPKAVRSSAGSLFHLPVVTGVTAPDALAAARRNGLRAVAADASGRVSHFDADLAGPLMLVLGGEARGLPSGMLSACDDTVRVEMFSGRRPGYAGHAESLNLAVTAAVLVFESVRQARCADGGGGA